MGQVPVEILLSYRTPNRLAGTMRRPDRTEAELAMLLFAGLVPTACYTVRFVLGLI